MKGHSLLIISIVIVVIILGIGFFIAITGRKSAMNQRARVDCLLNQFAVTRQLYLYKDNNKKFPKSLEVLLKYGNLDKCICPVTKKDYCYEVTDDYKNFTLYCSYTPPHSGDPYDHKPAINSSDEFINNRFLESIGYPYIHKQFNKNNNVDCVYVAPQSFLVKLKNINLGDTKEGKEKIKTIKEYLKKNNIEMNVKYIE